MKSGIFKVNGQNVVVIGDGSIPRGKFRGYEISTLIISRERYHSLKYESGNNAEQELYNTLVPALRYAQLILL